MSKEKRKGSETPRRKAGLPAKAGKRHLPNENHPRPRSREQIISMKKEVH